ncbi:probable JmjC domain-containing histone demethylation protein 2C isoform X2 [Acanthaster planci]|uniref:[histone H3]-dimethyl-L-lysine(9) demethylase n=1 Tax=Acanthaster planci TaxID=133434 RepID=A0A8B7YSV0_ACAPL|nr:probable JmjC domain-containing histone demethylation protein 2C isoform X2 [Acanthaster planci]
MGIEYREELVGKRFLCVNGPGKLKLGKISEWCWRAGVIRAVLDNGNTDASNEECTVYVEFDGLDWQKREWLRVQDEAHQVFLVEKTIVWGQRIDPYSSRPSNILWPALNFEILVDRVGLSNSNSHPLEFFLDRHLLCLKKDDIRPFEDDNPKTAQHPVFQRYTEVKAEVDKWLHEQKVQHILMKAPYPLTGYRVQVYRLGSTTQWFSAVITGHDLYTRELVVMDDTVLESHTENPALVQMVFLDDVVSSLLKGENVGITPRRRVNTANTTQATNTGTFSRPAPRSHSPAGQPPNQQPLPSKKKTPRSKLADVPEVEKDKDKDKEEKEKDKDKEKITKEKSSSNHKSKKDRKRKACDPIAPEDPKRLVTSPKRPLSHSASSELSLDKEKVKEKEKAPEGAKSGGEEPNSKEEKKSEKTQTKEEKKEAKREKEEKREGKEEKKSKEEKKEKKERKHHHHHSSRSPDHEKHSSRHRSKSRKHSNEDKKSETKDNAGLVSGDSRDIVHTERKHHKSKHRSKTRETKSKGESEPSSADSQQEVPTSIVVEPPGQQSSNTSIFTSATVPSVTSFFSQCVENIITREVTRDLERREQQFPQSKDSTSRAWEPPRVPDPTGANLFHFDDATSESTVGSVTARTASTITTSTIPATAPVVSTTLNSVNVNPSAVWTNPAPNPVTVISKLNPVSQNFDAESVTAPPSSEQKSPLREEGPSVEPKAAGEEEEKTVAVPGKDSKSDSEKQEEENGSGEPKTVTSKSSYETEELKDPRQESDNSESDSRKETRSKSPSSAKAPLYTSEPVQVYRDPNLVDSSVTHIESIQHFRHLSREHTPSPSHKILGPSPHSTLRATPTGIGVKPSAFVPSAGTIPSAGHIPGHPSLQRRPMFSQVHMYPHPLTPHGLSSYAATPHLAALEQQHLHPSHVAGFIHQDTIARLRPQLGYPTLISPQLLAQLQAQGLHPGGMSAAQLQALWQQQQQQHAASMGLPTAWVVHPEELSHLHHSQQQQQQQQQQQHQEKSQQAQAQGQSHQDSKLHTPRPTSQPPPHKAVPAPHDNGRDTTVRHYQEYPPSDAQALVQRHFQESLRKLQVPFSFNTSATTSSVGSITTGTAIPKREGHTHVADSESADPEERVRREREEKELEWQRLQREKEMKQQRERELERRLQPEKGQHSLSQMERDRYLKMHSSGEQARMHEDQLYRKGFLGRTTEGECLQRHEKDHATPSELMKLKTEEGHVREGHGFKVYHPSPKPDGHIAYYGTVPARYEDSRSGVPVRTEQSKHMHAFHVKSEPPTGYHPFSHAMTSSHSEKTGLEGDSAASDSKPSIAFLTRTADPLRTGSITAGIPIKAVGASRKDIPTPPPLRRDPEPGKAAEMALHTCAVQGRDNLGHQPTYTVAGGSLQHPSSQPSKSAYVKDGVDHRVGDCAHNVPVIVHSSIGKPPPLQGQSVQSLATSNRSTGLQPQSPLRVATPQQLSAAALQSIDLQKSGKSPSGYPQSTSHSLYSLQSGHTSLLMSALRPNDGGRPSDYQSPMDSSRGTDAPPAKRKLSGSGTGTKRKHPKVKGKQPETGDEVSPASNSNSEDRKPTGAFFAESYKSFVNDARNSQITGSAPEAFSRETGNNENIELKIEKVDQYRLGLEPSGPVSLFSDRINNGAMSDSDSTRSCSPKATGSESSDGRSVKTASPNRPGGHVNLKKKWLQRHNTSTINPSSGTTSTLTERKLYELGVKTPNSDSLKLMESQPKERLSQAIPNGHMQQAGGYLSSRGGDKPLNAVTLADIPKSSVPDHVYDFDNSSTCSDSSTTSKGRNKRGRESKHSKKHRDRKRHSSDHKSKHQNDSGKDVVKGRSNAVLDKEPTEENEYDIYKNFNVHSEGDRPAEIKSQIPAVMDRLLLAPKKRIVTRARKEKDKFDVLNVSRALVKPSISKLKKTGEPFLQDGACCDVTPSLMKCRECRMKPSSRQSKINIFCRFYAFRRLRYSKNGNLTIAGFSEPSHCKPEDLTPWLPYPPDTDCPLDVETSKYILKKVGDQFCELVEQEHQAKSWSTAPGKIAWKRAVTGVREMCDTCDTTLFNIHWTCSKCGFVVCLDCYKQKHPNHKAKYKGKPALAWLKCIKDQPHQPESLILTQIIPGTALWDVGMLVHQMRTRWNITCSCPCSKRALNNSPDKVPAINGLSPVVVNDKTPSESGKSEPSDSGQSTPVHSNSRSPKAPKLTSFPSASPLDVLANVASSAQSESTKCFTNSSSPKSYELSLPDTKAVTMTTDKVVRADTESAKSESCSKLRELLTKTAGKLGRPSGGVDGSAYLMTAFLPKGDNTNKKSTRTMTSTFEDIIATVVEQNISAPTLNKHDRGPVKTPTRPASQQTMAVELPSSIYTSPSVKPDSPSTVTVNAGTEAMLPQVRQTLTESSVEYPDVPHSWLCDGRLLRLHDASHKGNLRIFQEQWRRGVPVLVSGVRKLLDERLWHPVFFNQKFGELHNDLIDCSTGSVIQGAPMKDFWDGFEDIQNRLETKQGQPLILKLKDWPPAEDFAELLPDHFQDLMKNLPLPEYTRRDGRLNISSRLPDFFVKPDLGPKMYNAYGLAIRPKEGTTNLHLDISDAVNVMVYVGEDKAGQNGKVATEINQDILDAIDEVCRDEQTRQRARESGERPGAIWHLFHADDAVKIRELLTTVAREQGQEVAEDHDPIHDQSWYLDEGLLDRLHKEYGVQGWPILQCMGDAIVIPAGAPHQVRNLHSCIKVAEDFVSPEHISRCFQLTQEFRRLSDSHSNHEDKLQIKNIIFHAVKDAVGVLMSQEKQQQAAGDSPR